MRDEVIALVRQHVLKQEYYADLDFASIQEVPTANPQLFRCSIRITRTRYREAPGTAIAKIEERSYFVQVSGHRFTVRFEP